MALAGPVAARPPQGDRLTMTFIGNMAFRLSDGLLTVYTDFPYRPGYAGYMEYDPSGVTVEPGSFCLITHEHLDHWDPERFLRLQDVRVIAPPAITRGLPPDRVFRWGDSIRLRDVEILPIKTPHTDAHHSYRVEWRGRSLYFTGDTDSTEALLAQRHLDVAFVSPWLLRRAADQGGRIDADLVVVYHHLPGERVESAQEIWQPRQGESRELALDGADALRR